MRENKTCPFMAGETNCLREKCAIFDASKELCSIAVIAKELGKDRPDIQQCKI
ncbi:MAG: hypothetical protein P4L75_07075 [Clostridia bacterium]|nr:hypothetical protein [Clostridia bacterium]MDR3644261.1 hypothetical protein [Clostridia bacterium]